MSNGNEWGQIYQQNLSPEDAHSRSMYGDSLPVAAAAGSGSASATHLSAENRVAKPVRKRTRASRRTPTTMLNTSTSNFRAMVQQFTGGPSASFTMESNLHNSPNPQGFTVGFGQRQFDSMSGSVHPQNHLLAPRARYSLQQQQQVQHPQQGYDQFMFSYGHGTNTDSMAYHQGNPRSNLSEVTALGFGEQGRGVPHGSSSSSSETRRVNSFMY